jgi:hypothetical protein
MGKNYSVGSGIQSYSLRVHRRGRTILLDPVDRAIPSVSTGGEELFCWIQYTELFPACSQIGKNYSVGSGRPSYSQRIQRSDRTILLDPVFSWIRYKELFPMSTDRVQRTILLDPVHRAFPSVSTDREALGLPDLTEKVSPPVLT